MPPEPHTDVEYPSRGTSSGGRYAVSPIAPISLRRSAVLAAPLAAMVIAAALPARAQQPGEQGVVAGTVVAQGSLRPLPGAQVGTREGRGAIRRDRPLPYHGAHHDAGDAHGAPHRLRPGHAHGRSWRHESRDR